MVIIKIVFIAVACSVLAVTVKQIKPEFFSFIQIAAVLILMTISLSSVHIMIEKLSDFTQSSDSFITESVFTLFKVLVTAIVTKLASEICKDNGNSSIALCTELSGKIIIILMCFPLIKTIFELSLRFID